MNEYMIDHTKHWTCDKHCKEIGASLSMVIFANNDFHLIHFPRCRQEFGGHIDIAQELVEKIHGKTKTIDKENWYKVERSCRKVDLRNERNRQQFLKSYVYEVNYVYANASKQFHLCSKINGVDKLLNNELTYVNYLKALEYIKSKDFDVQRWLKTQLDEYLRLNTIYQDTSKRITQTIDEIVKQIKGITK